jgi:hypothetical protein
MKDSGAEMKREPLLSAELPSSKGVAMPVHMNMQSRVYTQGSLMGTIPMTRKVRHAYTAELLMRPKPLNIHAAPSLCIALQSAQHPQYHASWHLSTGHGCP